MISNEQLAKHYVFLLNCPSLPFCHPPFCCSLQENAVGNEGVTFLADALKANMSLQTLWSVFWLLQLIQP